MPVTGETLGRKSVPLHFSVGYDQHGNEHYTFKKEKPACFPPLKRQVNKEVHRSQKNCVQNNLSLSITVVNKKDFHIVQMPIGLIAI